MAEFDRLRKAVARLEEADMALRLRGAVSRLDADKWITVHPNGKDGKGTPALIGEGPGGKTVVKAGMGGKFNDKPLREVSKTGRAEASKEQAEHEARETAKAAETKPAAAETPKVQLHTSDNQEFESTSHAAVKPGDWAKMTPVEFSKLSPCRVVPGHGFDDAAHLGKIRRAVAELPKAHQKLLGARAPVVAMKFISFAGESTTGSTSGNAIGLFKSKARPVFDQTWKDKSSSVGQVSVASRVRVGQWDMPVQDDVAATTTHEMGHAIDYALGDASFSSYFQDTVKTAAASQTKQEAKKSRYYHLDPRETWAECYSLAFTPSLKKKSAFGGIPVERAKEIYAEPIAAMKKMIESRAAMVK